MTSREERKKEPTNKYSIPKESGRNKQLLDRKFFWAEEESAFVGLNTLTKFQATKWKKKKNYQNLHFKRNIEK